MKNNKKLNSIATMSKEELQDVNGGYHYAQEWWYYPKQLINGIPSDIYDFNQGWLENTAGMNMGI